MKFSQNIIESGVRSQESGVRKGKGIRRLNF